MSDYRPGNRKGILDQFVYRDGSPFFSVGAVAMQGYRSTMEDAQSIYTDPKGQRSIFAIYDGHSGSEVSEYMSKALPPELTKLQALDNASLSGVLLALDSAISKREFRNMGSTCVAAIIEPSTKVGSYTVTTVNIGDSRAMVIRRNGFEPLTQDHRPTDNIETARIEAAGGTVPRAGRGKGRVDGELAMSRAMGDHKYKSDTTLPQSEQKVIPLPSITRTTISKGDMLLIMCDGVVECIANRGVAEYVNWRVRDWGQGDPAALVQALLSHSLRHGSTDNQSAIMVCLNNGEHYKSHVQKREGYPILRATHSTSTVGEVIKKDTSCCQLL